MTLERIMRAAVAALAQGKRAPHSFRAWIQGKGYVNDGSAAYDRADYVKQAVRAAQSEVDNLGYAPSYAEPGYTQPARGIVFANWNHLPKQLGDILERAGYSTEWSDEWSTCEDCQRAFRTSADSYIWQPAGKYIESLSADLCNKCAKEAEGESE